MMATCGTCKQTIEIDTDESDCFDCNGSGRGGPGGDNCIFCNGRGIRQYDTAFCGCDDDDDWIDDEPSTARPSEDKP